MEALPSTLPLIVELKTPAASAALLAAIARRRAERAAELMLEHLNHIEASLDLKAPPDDAVDLATALMAR